MSRPPEIDWSTARLEEGGKLTLTLSPHMGVDSEVWAEALSVEARRANSEAPGPWGFIQVEECDTDELIVSAVKAADDPDLRTTIDGLVRAAHANALRIQARVDRAPQNP